nr:hypothetical transcript [Hymenolepis microstoma]
MLNDIPREMIAIVLVFAWLQINASLGNVDSNSTDTICSKIITKSNKKTEPLLIKAGGRTNFYVALYNRNEGMTIEDGECKTRSNLKWKPCNINNGYVNISMKKAPKIDQLSVIGSNYACVINFVPKCDFKPAREAAPILEASFPFIRYAAGMNSVRVNFSLKSTVPKGLTTLRRNNDIICKWNRSTLVSELPGHNCGNLTENTRQNSLDYTREYQRNNTENVTYFLFHAGTKSVGITIDWTKNEGVSVATSLKKYSNPTVSHPNV